MRDHGPTVDRRTVATRGPGTKTLDLREGLGMLAEHWGIVVSSALAGLVMGLLAAALIPPKYEATATLYVSVQAGESGETAALLDGTSFVQASMTSYADVATTTLVLDQVANELNFGMSSSQLAEVLDVTVPTDSVLLKITATHTDPATVAQIANTTGNVLTQVVEHDIANRADGQASPVQARMVDSATASGQPVSLNALTAGTLGTAFGLLLGIGLVVLRHVVDSRVRVAKDLEQVTGLPVIGQIPNDTNIAERPLIAHDDPRTQRAEAYRILRTNLQFLRVGDQHKTFMVSSAMPGEGKTHVAANLGIVLADAGAHVTIIDADLRKPRLAEVMGIAGGAGLSDVLIGRAELTDVLQPWGLKNLSVLPSGQIPPNPSELLGSPGMRVLLEELQKSSDYVIIDALPILPVTDAAVLASITSGTLLVASLGQTKRQHLDQALERLMAVENSPLGVIANRVPPKTIGAYGATRPPQKRRTVRAGE